ncbi:efflux RND transporter periplasmic adaptor subunit [bacterium]|nr:efflux RND transporter periplasmic adaptor subunit [bacterium]
MKKILVPIFLLVILVIAVFYRLDVLRGQENLTREGIEAIQEREGFPVTITTVVRGHFTVWRTVQGKVEGYRQALITTPEAARVAVIRAKVGDPVQANTPIISLDENDPKNKSRVKLLRSVYEDALNDFEKYKKLYESGGVSKDVLDKTELKLEAARTDLESAKSTVHLTCPFDGILLALYVREGENAESDKTLAVVSSLGTVRIVTSVSDRDVREFQPGQKVLVRYNSQEPLEGTVERVGLGANPDNGLFDLELKVKNTNAVLKSGMFVSAEILIVDAAESLSLDTRAIRRDFQGQDYVWLVKDGTATKRSITIVYRNETHCLIEGLAENSQVVLSGKDLLREGVRLLILNGESH